MPWWKPWKPILVLASEARVYLTRWSLLPVNRWCRVYLHRITGPDEGRDLHDHPWWGIFGVLRGSYEQEISPDGDPKNARLDEVRWVNTMRPRRNYHRITQLRRAAVWTIGFCWIRRPREWGFWVPGKGHVDRHSYRLSERAVLERPLDVPTDD